MRFFFRDCARYLLILIVFYALATFCVVVLRQHADEALTQATRAIAMWALVKAIWPDFGGK